MTGEEVLLTPESVDALAMSSSATGTLRSLRDASEDVQPLQDITTFTPTTSGPEPMFQSLP